MCGMGEGWCTGHDGGPLHIHIASTASTSKLSIHMEVHVDAMARGEGPPHGAAGGIRALSPDDGRQ
jgi:hypothetical protein